MAADRADRERSEGAAPSLDAIDLAVLDELLRDARASQRSIGRAVGMSAPAVGERIARLERAGVITGYQAVVDRRRLGFPVTTYISVQVFETGPRPVQMLQALAGLEEVEAVSIVTGPMDLMVRVRVRDHEHLRQALFSIWAIEGVQRTETFLSIQENLARAYDRVLIARLRAELETLHESS